jgi:drug/metabolite transporter (DMT)-like permease
MENFTPLAVVSLSFSLAPVVALIAGVLILIMPRLLNYIVALYLIFIGLIDILHLHL